ncbi:hypothetical protein ACEYYA_13420 [Paracoccus sp. p3-h83]|uniref:hypothetical protein n=1 Tax=Paracoccus sp. p3-h83 TaxID=3342805 RepID=UPI0035B84ECE
MSGKIGPAARGLQGQQGEYLGKAEAHFLFAKILIRNRHPRGADCGAMQRQVKPDP